MMTWVIEDELVSSAARRSLFSALCPEVQVAIGSLTACLFDAVSQESCAEALASGDWAGCRGGGQLSLGERGGAKSDKPEEGAFYSDPGKSAALPMGRCAHLRGACMGPEVPLGACAG